MTSALTHLNGDLVSKMKTLEMGDLEISIAKKKPISSQAIFKTNLHCLIILRNFKTYT